MERGSSKHGPRVDEELAHELEGAVRANRPTRAQEWRGPEPPADDDSVEFGKIDHRSELPRKRMFLEASTHRRWAHPDADGTLKWARGDP